MRRPPVSAWQPASTRIAVGWLFILTASILGEDRLQADTSKPLDSIVRQVLTEYLISKPVASSLRENRIAPAHVRAIVHDNLDPGLSAPVMEATGTDFRFTPSGPAIEAQAAVLILSYPDEKTVGSMIKKLAKMGGYFKRTKILTRFSCAQVDNRLLIAFTENAGDQDLVQFIDEFPELIESVYK